MDRESRAAPRILSLHPGLDPNPLWRRRATPVAALDPVFHERALWGRLWSLARNGGGFDVCVFSPRLSPGFRFLATHLMRRLHGARNVQAESYLAFAVPGDETPEERRRIGLYRLLFSATDLVTVQASFEPEIYARRCGGRTSYRWVPWYFYGEARPVPPRQWRERWRQGLVLCPGSHRDAATFAAAVRGLGRRCVLVVRGEDVPGLPAPESLGRIEVRIDLPRAAYWALFDEAAVVVLPFHGDRLLRSLGHIAYFAAALRRVPVLTSRTPHLADYARPGIDVAGFAPGDPLDLRRQLERLLTDAPLANRLARAARRRTLGRFSQDEHVRRLLAEIDALE